MSQYTLTAQTRKPGKSTSRAFRRDMWIPSVVYGPKSENKSFAISYSEFLKLKLTDENTIITLSSDQDAELNNRKVMIKKVDRNAHKNTIIHIDFYEPDMTATIKVEVEIVFEGKSVGVTDGGAFEILKRQIEVECLPTEIPETIAVDITKYKIKDSILVSDVPIPSNMKLVTSEDIAIARVTETRETKEAAAPEAAADPAAAAAVVAPTT